MDKKNSSLLNLTLAEDCIFDSAHSLVEGCRLPVRMKNANNEWNLAEIVSIKEDNGIASYYVHYVDCKLD